MSEEIKLNDPSFYTGDIGFIAQTLGYINDSGGNFKLALDKFNSEILKTVGIKDYIGAVAIGHFRGWRPTLTRINGKSSPLGR